MWLSWGWKMACMRLPLSTLWEACGTEERNRSPLCQWIKVRPWKPPVYLCLSLLSACWSNFLLLSNDFFLVAGHSYWQLPGPYSRSLETSEETEHFSLFQLLLEKLQGRTLALVRRPLLGLLTSSGIGVIWLAIIWAMCPFLLPKAGVLYAWWVVGLQRGWR